MDLDARRQILLDEKAAELRRTTEAYTELLHQAYYALASVADPATLGHGADPSLAAVDRPGPLRRGQTSIPPAPALAGFLQLHGNPATGSVLALFPTQAPRPTPPPSPTLPSIVEPKTVDETTTPVQGSSKDLMPPSALPPASPQPPLKPLVPTESAQPDASSSSSLTAQPSAAKPSDAMPSASTVSPMDLLIQKPADGGPTASTSSGIGTLSSSWPHVVPSSIESRYPAYTDSLPPLPNELLRSRVQIGGMLKQRLARENRSGQSTGSTLGGGTELYKLGIVRANCMGVRPWLGQAGDRFPPGHVGKIVTSSQWQVAVNELRTLRAMERIELLKGQKLWSFRQIKKQKGPVVVKAHWDHVLDEMKWLQTDFKQERRWKQATAYAIAQAVVEWHQADPETRRMLCINGRKESTAMPMDVDEDELGESDVAASLQVPRGGEEEVDDSMAVDEEVDPRPENSPEVALAPPPKPSAEGTTMVTAEQLPPGDLEPVKNEATGPAAQLAQPPPAATPQPEASGSTPAPTKDGQLSFAQVVSMRGPIFTFPDTKTVFDLEELPLAKYISETTTEYSAPDLLATIMTELPGYIWPPANPDNRPDRRFDESTPHFSRISHASRLLETKPLLVSTLQPAKRRISDRHGPTDWGEVGDLLGEDATAGYEQPASQVPIGCTLFSGRKPKESSNAVPVVVPPQPQHIDLEARAASFDWTADEDDLLYKLTRQYSFNWSLIAEVFNSSTVRVPTDHRLPWDVYDRWNKRYGPGSLAANPPQPSPSEAGLTPDAAVAAARARAAAGQAPQQSSMRKQTGRVDSKKKSRHMAQHQAIRNLQKKRDMQPKPISMSQPRRVNLSAHESHTMIQRPYMTALDMSKLKGDRDTRTEQALIEQQRMMTAAAHAQQQQQRQQAQAGREAGSSAQPAVNYAAVAQKYGEARVAQIARSQSTQAQQAAAAGSPGASSSATQQIPLASLTPAQQAQLAQQIQARGNMTLEQAQQVIQQRLQTLRQAGAQAQAQQAPGSPSALPAPTVIMSAQQIANASAATAAAAQRQREMSASQASNHSAS